MTPEQYERVRELFLAAREKDPAQRATFLGHACDDAHVRAEVESLLASNEKGDTFLQTPALGGTLAINDPAELLSSHPTMASAGARGGSGGTDLPERIGQYRILAVLGEGGMGVVYRAKQESPRRTVALKVIKPGLRSREALKRFEHEGQVLAWLQHPGIAQIFEAGTADAGHGPQPFFAMEFVQGRSLMEYAQAGHLNLHQRLQLMARICEAVHHAHQKGVIHRDLKPANILVDESGQPKVLDFGVARVTDADIRTTTLQTAVGQLVGTIAYMSPEQVAGDPRELDTRSDVYALGVIAYELLTGRTPVDLADKTIPQAARAIVEEEPASLRSLNRTLGGDIETVIAKALEKDKARRYQSASDLAADIRCYLSDQPISARPATTLYQLRKFARRNRPLVTGVCVAFVALVIGIAGTTSQAVRATHARNEAQAAETEAERRRAEAEAERAEAERQAAIALAVNTFLNQDLLAAADPLQKGRDITVREVLGQATAKIEDRFEGQPLVEAAIRRTLGETYMNLGEYDSAEPQFQRAAELRLSELGPEHPDTLKAQLLLGYVFTYQGRLAEAEPIFRQILDTQRRILAPDDPELLSTLGVLGVVYKRQGLLDQAEPLYLEVLETRRRVLGNGHRHTITSMSNLAILYRIQERYEEAERLYLEAIEQSRNARGDDHPDTLRARQGLAVVYRRQERYDEAEALYSQVLETQRRILGEDHPETLLTMTTLANLCDSRARPEAAEPLYLEAIDRMSQTLGAEHPQTLKGISNLGRAYVQWGRYAEADELLPRALEARRRVLGEDHLDTIGSMGLVARLRAHQERHDEALTLWQEAFERRRRTLGAEHLDTLHAASEMAATLISLKRYNEAEPILLTTLQTLREKFGTAHRVTQRALSHLVELYETTGPGAAAAEYRALLQPSTESPPGPDSQASSAE